MDIYHSLETAKSDYERASGEEDDKRQAHDCAVCYFCMAYAIQVWDQGRGNLIFSTSRFLCACRGSCRLVIMVIHFTVRVETILSTRTAARAESFIFSSIRVISPVVGWRRYNEVRKGRFWEVLV